LWRIIPSGVAPHDMYNLTATEEVEEQLNATAKHLIQQAVSDSHSNHINSLGIAKDVWDYLTMLFIGNKIIKFSKFEKLKSREENFIMLDTRPTMRCIKCSRL
jgi:hypothetical protein